MNFYQSLMAALGTLVIASSAANADLVPAQALVATGPGGSVVDFARQVSNARMANQDVTFAGRCESACTLYLALPASRVCLTQGASFTFHLPYGATEDFNSWAASYMLEHYPGWVRGWIVSQGGLTNSPLHMDYAFASQFLPTCNGSGPDRISS